MQLRPVFVFGVSSYPERFSDDKCELKICMTSIPENLCCVCGQRFWASQLFWVSGLENISSEINSAQAADIAVV